jgi:nitroreductase
MVSRRAMMAGGAGAAVLAAFGYRGVDRGAFSNGKGPAYAAWQAWRGRPGEGITRPIHAAILASSAHNTQPWLFEAHEDVITLYADLSKNLGAADPFRRELFASIGCTLHNLSLAAGAVPERLSLDLADRLHPNPASDVVKICDLVPSRPRGSATIAKRHTNRGPYQDRAVPAEFFRANPNARFVSDPGAVKELGALIIEATGRFIADPEMSRDSGRWMRTGRREIERYRDGVTVDTAGLSPLMTGLAKMLPDQDSATADKYWLASTRDVQVPTAPAFGVLFSSNRLSAHQAIAAGSAWQQLHLAATEAGLAAQPMNAPIEVMDRDHFLGRSNSYARDIAKIAKLPLAADPAFLFRIGYAARPAALSPRRRFEDVLRRRGFA